MKICKKCKQNLSMDLFPPSRINKDGKNKTCFCCLRKRKNELTAASVAKSMLKELKTEQKKRPKTPQQLRRIEEEKIYKKNRKELLDEMFEKHGRYFCQHSGEQCERSDLEAHHIVFRSEARNHPELHNKRNLILVVEKSHRWYEKNKSNRKKLVEERGLEELFGKRISFYQNTKCTNTAEKSDTVQESQQELDSEETSLLESQRMDISTDAKGVECTI